MDFSRDTAAQWIVHAERPIYESRWVTLSLADVSLPSGERFEHHTMSTPPAAMIVALDDAGERVLMAWRHRFVPDRFDRSLGRGGERPRLEGESRRSALPDDLGGAVRELIVARSRRAR